MLLSVVTPERAFLEEECSSVVLPGLVGEMQVLPGHVASLVELKTGMVVYENPNREHVRFIVSNGFAEIESGHVIILCERARAKTEVDKSGEEALQENLLEELKKANKEEEELKKIKAELEISIASLKLLE